MSRNSFEYSSNTQSLSLPLLLLLFVAPTKTATDVATTHQSRNYYLDIYPNVAWPPGLGSCTLIKDSSNLACSHWCAISQTCVSVYSMFNGNATSTNPDDLAFESWDCYICNSIVTPGNFTEGPGNYIIMKYIDLGRSPTPISGAIFNKVDYVNGFKAAFYNCSVHQRRIRFAVEPNTGMWHRLRDTCLNSLCDRASLSASLMVVTFNQSGFVFTPKCLAEETTDGYSHCTFEGVWTDTSISGVHCISPTCYRQTASLRAIYNGDLRVSTPGGPCQRWDSLIPHNHIYQNDALYVEDGFSYVNAENKCRDPDTSEAPWCYNLDPNDRWSYCDVPLCQ